MKPALSMALCLALSCASGFAQEKSIVSLRDFSTVELKSAGFDCPRNMTVHIRATGGSADNGWTRKTDEMYAYGWVINADTREVVWKMNIQNTSRSGGDRLFDGTLSLDRGSYEVYFTAYAFENTSTFAHFTINIDHRNKPLFGDHHHSDRNAWTWFKDFWSEDIEHEFVHHAPLWGIDVSVNSSEAYAITSFVPPKSYSNTVARAIGLGDDECARIAFELSDETRLHLYAIGERSNDGELSDYGWIVNLADRSYAWDMESASLRAAGGASKNVEFNGDVSLSKGRYMLYFVTDKTHSLADWNQAPPADPLNYGMTIAVSDDQSRKQFHQFSFDDYQNVIVSIVHPGDDFHESRGFSLKRDASIRVLAVGERANGRRSMADYGVIVNARTRAKVWTMDVERTHHAGGASKNRYVDEVLHLPKGTYIVSYYTDDSHSYDDWNDDPPFDPSHYGITVMGADPDFSPSDVGPYVEEKDKSLIAQIVRVGDDEDKSETFTLDRPTRIRVYAIGEGQGRDMSDYGMIEDTKTGTSIWEMTYAMTFHAGGARKNRMVNITITLERGTYKLRYLTDGSHSYEEWNADPPDDPEYYGISLYREDDRPSVSIPPIPQQPAMRVPPHPPLPH